MVPSRPLARPAEIAAFLGVPEKTLTQWRYRRTGPPWTPVGRHVRYDWRDVEQWIAERRKVAVR